MANEDFCVCCGAPIPEGTMVCKDCDIAWDGIAAYEKKMCEANCAELRAARRRNEMFFLEPTPVIFFLATATADPNDSKTWQGGIGYGKEIICGCCGGVIEIAEVYNEAEEYHIENPIIRGTHWVNINEEIKERIFNS